MVALTRLSGNEEGRTGGPPTSHATPVLIYIVMLGNREAWLALKNKKKGFCICAQEKISVSAYVPDNF